MQTKPFMICNTVLDSYKVEAQVQQARSNYFDIEIKLLRDNQAVAEFFPGDMIRLRRERFYVTEGRAQEVARELMGLCAKNLAGLLSVFPLETFAEGNTECIEFLKSVNTKIIVQSDLFDIGLK